MTVKKNLDKLIDWYEKFKPEAGQRIACTCTRDTLAKFCSAGPNSELYYRNRVVYPTKNT
jgi:hypothetical protein